MSEAGADHSAEAVRGVSVPAPHHHVNYLAVFGTLVVLTVLTVAAAFMNLKQEWQKILLALTIASIKAVAVVVYFMHLKFEGKLIYLILLVPVFLSIVLVVSLIPDIVHALQFETLAAYPGQGK
jgi:cytochrome c oxidase subunit 4